MSYRGATTRQCSPYNIHIFNLTLTFYNSLPHFRTKPIPGAARPKVWVCGRSFAGRAGSNPTRGMDVCYECCVLSGRGLCDGPITRTEESYRLCTCVWVWSCILDNEVALADWEILRHGRVRGEEGCGGVKLPHTNVTACHYSATMQQSEQLQVRPQGDSNKWKSEVLYPNRRCNLCLCRSNQWNCDVNFHTTASR